MVKRKREIKLRKRRKRRNLERLLDELEIELAWLELRQARESIRRSRKRRLDYIA